MLRCSSVVGAWNLRRRCLDDYCGLRMRSPYNTEALQARASQKICVRMVPTTALRGLRTQHHVAEHAALKPVCRFGQIVDVLSTLPYGLFNYQ